MSYRLPILALAAATALTLAGCGGHSGHEAHEAPANDARAEMPDDELHRGVAAHGSDLHGGMTGMMGSALNREVTLDDAVRSAWRAIRVEIADLEGGDGLEVEVPLGGAAALGDSGLTLEAKVFVPDFVMDGGGISSRSAAPANPAAKIVIREAGVEDYQGWLFATMPEIHPYPHARYRVRLIAGVPAT